MTRCWKLQRPSVFLLAVALLVGCGTNEEGASTPDANATAIRPARSDSGDARSSQTPDQTVQQFLQSLKTGDREQATSLLTSTAQEEMARTEAFIQPPGSATAQFSVQQVEYVGAENQGAHVLSVWSDEHDGTAAKHEIVWILRKEDHRWAVAGFATKVFEDRPPLVLNFENPLELQQKRAAVDAEIARRQDSILR